VSGFGHGASASGQRRRIARAAGIIEPYPGERPTTVHATTLVEVFDRSVRANPDRVALVYEHTEHTYGRLDEWSNSIAQWLRDNGVRPGDRVALRLAPCADVVAAILGILKCAAAYVPLDIRNPRARSEFVLADAGAVAFVGDLSETDTNLPHLDPETLAALASRPTVSIATEVSTEDIAYVIYTSGTTGTPKGVPIRHGNVVALLDATAPLFEFDRDDRWLLFHSVAFDFSVWEIWGALCTGAGLVVLPHWTARDPAAVVDVIVANEVTVLNQTPTAFAALAATAQRRDITLSGLRYVVFGGEKLLPSTLSDWVARHGVKTPRLVNMYGITETTVHTTFHELTAEDLDDTGSPIGRPLPGFEALVVDDDGTPVAPGEVGELWLTGPQVAGRYLDRPELTAERFGPAVPGGPACYRSGDLVAQRPDGTLEYHGRKDLQVKLRGHRIELGDIEEAVRSYAGVTEAVVFVHDFGDGDLRLVCAYLPAAGPVKHRELRAHVKALLPSYMHPSAYQEIDELPRTVNGKLDRARIARSREQGA
jgi:amino acid adenylation domain-containing protein